MNNSVTIAEVAQYVESMAPLSLQEGYDNAGLQVGNPAAIVNGVVCTLDVTEEVVTEAIRKQANLIIAHHPVIFTGLKKITGSNSTERIILSAIRHHIAIYVAHTNLDNAFGGVNKKIAEKLKLTDVQILQPAKNMLRKLVTFVPVNYIEKVQQAVFTAGAGQIGNYDQCSFNSAGEGTFRGNENTSPFVGARHELHHEPEIRFETIYPVFSENAVISALLAAHPYEEVAYDIYTLENHYSNAGSGVTGCLPAAVSETEFLEILKTTFGIPVIRHSPLCAKPVEKVAICGGAGAFLVKDAIKSGADAFITGDIKYHQFFESNQKVLMADIGHFESEQFTRELFYELLTKKFSTFAVHLSEVVTNPINYFI